jgi:hypothetical protein
MADYASMTVAYAVRFGVGFLSPSLSIVDVVPGPVPTCPLIMHNRRSDLSPGLSPPVPPARPAPVPSPLSLGRGQGTAQGQTAPPPAPS